MGRKKRGSVSGILTRGDLQTVPQTVEVVRPKRTKVKKVPVVPRPRYNTPTPRRTVTIPGGVWLPIDAVFSAIENGRRIELPPRARPVTPAEDWECYRLNPPRAEHYNMSGEREA